MSRPSKSRQAGFTIVELMIATMVFSVILIIITYGVLSFSKAYYKGVNTASTQTTARTLIDTISQSIQFNGGSIDSAADGSGLITTYCIGNKQYDFVLGKQLTSLHPAATDHAIYETPISSTGACTPASFDATQQSRELLGPHMRLADFSITPPSGKEGLFKIHVRVVYGDDDLLHSKSGNTIPALNVSDQTECNSDTGDQYCAVADLETTVEKRVQ